MTQIAEPASRTLRQHLRFTRDEIPSLVGILGTVVALHVIGWGLFIYFNSNPDYHGISDSKGVLVYAGAGAQLVEEVVQVVDIYSAQTTLQLRVQE